MLSHREASGIAGISIAIAAVFYVILLAILGIFLAAIIKIIDLIFPGAPLRAVPMFVKASKVFLVIAAFLWSTFLLIGCLDPSLSYDWILYTAAGASALMFLCTRHHPAARKSVIRFLVPMWTMTAVSWFLYSVGAEEYWLGLLSQIASFPLDVADFVVSLKFSVTSLQDNVTFPIFYDEAPWAVGVPSVLFWGVPAAICLGIAVFTESLGQKGWLTRPEQAYKAEQPV